MKIAIVSGGTGGHIYPGLAIADEIKRSDSTNEIAFIGSEEGLEKDIVTRQGFKIKLIKSRAMVRKISYKAISAPFISIVGFFQALAYLRSFAPDALLSTGGYASLPAVLAALILRIPVFIHEQNVLPGVTNRIYFKYARKVFLSFEDTLKYFPAGEVVGNPVRKDIQNADRAVSRKAFNYLPEKRVVLIMGGSQGARTINNTVLSSLPKIKTNNLELLHIIGKRDFDEITKNIDLSEYPFYHPVAYLYNMNEALAAADIVISRAGATAIAEFLARGLPMVLVPFPYSAEGHQALNAEYVERHGAGIKIDNSAFIPDKFIELLNIKDEKLEKMKKSAFGIAKHDAAKKIIDGILGSL